jgi:hypothetical protein
LSFGTIIQKDLLLDLGERHQAQPALSRTPIMRAAAVCLFGLGLVSAQPPAPPDGSGDCRLEDVENEIRYTLSLSHTVSLGHTNEASDGQDDPCLHDSPRSG